MKIATLLPLLKETNGKNTNVKRKKDVSSFYFLSFFFFFYSFLSTRREKGGVGGTEKKVGWDGWVGKDVRKTSTVFHSTNSISMF